MNRDFYMRLALNAAWRNQLLTYPNPAVGACLLDTSGAILAVAAHEKAGEAHAEVLALRDGFLARTADQNAQNALLACKTAAEIHDFLRAHHNGIFDGATLFVTLEPCNAQGKTPACAPLISALGVRNVVIGSSDRTPQMAGGAAFLEQNGARVTRGVLLRECDRLIEPFYIWRERPFLLFKRAQRLNGTINGGVISNQAAQKEVHQLRSLCDLLLIGGNTVRTDRPTLDARFADHGRASDVLIYSAHSDFDRTIPLFAVPNRRVMISSDLGVIGDRRFVLIEGGDTLLNALWERIDLLLVYQSGNIDGSFTSGFSRRAEPLFYDTISDNLKIWLKPRN